MSPCCFISLLIEAGSLFLWLCTILRGNVSSVVCDGIGVGGGGVGGVGVVGGGVDVRFFDLLYDTVCQSVLCGSGVGVAV